MVFQGKNITIEQTNVMKGVAILSVVMIHMFQGTTDTSLSSVLLMFNQFARFAVPVFLILSGIGLERSGKAKLPYRLFIKGRLAKLLPLYLFWTVVYHIANNREWTFLGVAKSLLLGGSSAQMYYVVVIMVLYLMYPLIRKAAISKLGLTALMVLTVVTQVMALFMPNILFGGLNVICWLGYFAAGIYAANFDIKLSKFTIMAILTIGIVSTLYLGFLGFGTSMKPSVILYTVGLMFFMTSWKSKVLQTLGKHSFNIYLCHMLVIMVLAKCITLFNLEMSIVTTYPIVIALSLAFSLIYLNFIKKLSRAMF